MSRPVLLALAAVSLAAPAAAQTHEHGDMPGMSMPAAPAQAAPEPAQPEAGPAPSPPPAWSGDYAADRYWDPAAMAHARMMAREEMGGMRFSKLMLNLAEYQAGAGRDGYRWEGEAWYGGDYNRLVLRSEGEGGGEGLEAGEVQALWSRAISRYVDLQGGVRQDFSPHARTYLALGGQALFPFWFEASGALFLSTKGELLARAESSYDVRLTQRLVLQPRAELNFAARDMPKARTGAGLSNAELGLRLRYELRREFAPYVGVSWDRRVGRTADYFRAAGEDPASTTFVAGIRAWF